MPDGASLDDMTSAKAESKDPIVGGADGGLYSGLADLKRKEIGATEKVTGELMGGISADQARIKKAYDAEGIGPDEMKPWNAQEEHKKFETAPIDAFGSVASVFALAASAFTHAPMTNALNGAAAAMNAIREGDEKGYERAHGAWKENNDLALKRHNIQHEAYSDAIALMNSNIAAGRTKMQVLASRFGDEKTLFMLENGMDKEVIDLQAARQKQAEGMLKLGEEFTLANARKKAMETDPSFTEPDKSLPPAVQAAQQLAAANRIYGIKESAEQQAIGLMMAEKMQKGEQVTADDIAKVHQKFQIGRGGPEAQQRTQLVEEKLQAIRDEGREPTPEERKQILDEAFAKPSSAGGMGRQESQAVDELMKKRQAEGKPISRTDAIAEVKRAAATPSGNRMDDLKQGIDRIGTMEQTIDKVEALLKKHNAIAGLGGKITRGGEVVSNIFGSNETDRKQFERYVSELKELAPRALTGSNGRPLAAEAGNVSNIVAGLQLGDTTANTARAYLELRQLLKKLKGGLAGRRSGGSDAPTIETPKQKPSWQNAPLVN